MTIGFFQRPAASALALLTSAALGLSACGDGAGDGTGDGAPQNGATAQAGAGTGPKTAAQAPAADPDALPKLKCPVKPDKALAGPDIIGLKLGMTKEAALNLVRCHTNDAAHLDFQRNWLQGLKSHRLQLGPQAFTAMHGDTTECNFRNFSEMQRCGPGNRVWEHVAEKITVATPGVPGRETVVGIWRTQSFKPGAMPAVESVIAALSEKYGAPQSTDIQEHRRGNWTRIRWVSDLGGQPLTNPNPLFQRCAGAVDGRMNQVSWTQGCGLNIAADIRHSADNPDLVGEMSVGMLHQDNLYRYGTDVQAELDDIEQTRRDQELEQVKKSGSDVKL